MDKNTIIGLVLMAAVLIGFSWYNTNQENNLQGNQTEQTSQKAADNKQADVAAKTVILIVRPTSAPKRLPHKLLPTALTSFLPLQRAKHTMWC